VSTKVETELLVGNVKCAQGGKDLKS
jgi:hypothetical protein